MTSQQKSTSVKTDVPPFYLENSSPSLPSATQKTQIQPTCNELLLSDTESVTSYTLQPEDADSYNFLPFQDHINPISRPSHIPILKTQMLQPHITQSKHIKDTPTIQKARPSCIPVPKDKKCLPVIKDSHLNQPKDLQTSNSPTVPSKQITKQESTLLMQKTTPVTTHSQQTRKPLLPMPPALTRETVTLRPPPYYNRQQQCISGPFRTANYNQ